VEFQAFAGLNITGNQGTDSFFNGLQQAWPTRRPLSTRFCNLVFFCTHSTAP
jgi:hypothetical protein